MNLIMVLVHPTCVLILLYPASFTFDPASFGLYPDQYPILNMINRRGFILADKNRGVSGTGTTRRGGGHRNGHNSKKGGLKCGSG